MSLDELIAAARAGDAAALDMLKDLVTSEQMPPDRMWDVLKVLP